MFGFSRGGMMSYLIAKNLGTKTTPSIKAMVVWAGVTDFAIELPLHQNMEAELLSLLIPGYKEGNTRFRQQALRMRSAQSWMEQIPQSLPLLLLHGDADPNVSVQNSIQMAARLKARGQPHKLVIYPGDDHELHQHRDEAEEELVNWFKKYLQAGKGTRSGGDQTDWPGYPEPPQIRTLPPHTVPAAPPLASS